MIGTGNIIAVELDRKNGGADSWLALVRKHHNVCTLHAHDGDGREYFLFANPNGMNAGTLARGLRVIDHTGISGFPDNLTIHGLPCSWWADCDAAKTPLVPAPDWLVRIPLSRTGRGNSRDPHQALISTPKRILPWLLIPPGDRLIPYRSARFRLSTLRVFCLARKAANGQQPLKSISLTTPACSSTSRKIGGTATAIVPTATGSA
jgi:hypothetical protein